MQYLCLRARRGGMEVNMSKILIIEDDLDIAAVEAQYLMVSDFEVEIVNDGIKGLQRAKSGEHDLLILDLMLPGMDGFTLCKELRTVSDIPLIMVTARHEDIDKIRGLGYGADDYVEKPFSPSVLVARVKANLTRYQMMKTKKDVTNTKNIIFGKLQLDTGTHRLYKENKEISLKNKEYELLLFLMCHPDQVFDREDIYEYVWGLESMGDNITVAVHMNRLREKIEDDPQNPEYLQTVWGAGYRFFPKV